MTDEVRKLVDGLSTADIETAYAELDKCMVVRRSDVVELVEKLTKWNKVEDCLPKKTKIPYQVIGKVLPHKIIGSKELKNTYVIIWIGGKEPEFKSYCERLNVTEWKPII